MTRTVTSAVDTAAQAGAVTDCLLAAFDFSSGMLRMTTAPFDIAWSGNSYLGNRMVKVEPVEEGADQQAHEARFTLSGILPEHVTTALGEHYQGRDAWVWWATLDEYHRPLADPVLLFKGRMDVMEIGMGRTAAITLTVQSRLADWARARVRRFNDADQQAEYPGDLFFQYQEQMVSVELLWGAPGTSPSPVQAAPAEQNRD